MVRIIPKGVRPSVVLRLRGTVTVPTPRISACTITKTSSKWAGTCRTIVPTGSKARVMRGSHVTDTAKVKSGLVKEHGTGKPGAYVLVVDRKHNKHTSLAV
jgi:hypothetical protein